MANQERDPRAYELMTVFVPDISEEDTVSQVDKVSEYISSNGGNVNETLTESPWGRRRLAYTIRYNGTDYRDGFYTVYHFDAKPSDLTELERALKLDTNVMRYLLVHDDPKAGEKHVEGEEDESEAAAESEPSETESSAAASESQEAASSEQPAASTESSESSDEAASEEAPAETETGQSAEAAANPGANAQNPADDAPAEETESSDDAAEKE